MNKKLNSIIAIIISIIIISIMLFLSLSKEKTQADIINEQLKKQNASWVAKDYPSDIINLPEVYIEEDIEDNLIDEHKNYIFNTETKNKFIPENYDYSDLIVSKNYPKTKLSGLLFLTTNLTTTKNLELEDQLNWKNYFTEGKKQMCGSCVAMGIVAGLEAYVNRKYAINNNLNFQKISFSPQYLIYYPNFMGCSGMRPLYYLYFIHLNNTNPENLNYSIKTKLKTQLNQINRFNVSTSNNISLNTHIQYSIHNGEVPFGVPLERDVPFLGYDSCEIITVNRNSNITQAGMDLTPLNFIPVNYIDSNFCPDNADMINSTKKIDGHNFYNPEKKNINKYFIEYTFKVDSNCRNLNTSVQNIKDALTVSPLIASFYFYPSIHRYKTGVWEKLNDEKISENNQGVISSHGIVISGWGVDKISGKEYWILKNNWNDNWGENSYLKTWIGDKDLNIECRDIYGFGGELITKSGTEINAIYDQIKFEEENSEEIEREIQENERLRQENLQRRIENMPQPITPVPDYPNDIDPLNEYNIININYQDTKYISDTECLTIMGCMSNKLNGFYGNNTSENGFT